MVSRNDWIDSEIARLEGLRGNVRNSIEAMEEDNSTGASFEGRDIQHLPLEILKQHEGEYTLRINQLIMDKQGEDYLFGQTVQFKYPRE